MDVAKSFMRFEVNPSPPLSGFETCVGVSSSFTPCVTRHCAGSCPPGTDVEGCASDDALRRCPAAVLLPFDSDTRRRCPS